MKIAQSTVDLVSTHKYYEENSVTVSSGVVTRSSFLENLKNQEKKMDTLELDEKADLDGDEAIGSETYTHLKPQTSNIDYLGTMESSLEEQFAQLRASLLDRLLSLLQLFGGENQSKGYKDLIQKTSNMLTSNSFVKVTTVKFTHTEEETTDFSGKGIAHTEDGRTIDFNVNFSLSRKLTAYAGMSVSSAVSLVDPLVINVGKDITSISDQNFYFDLDSNGTEEKISAPGQGNGFLAYDRNGDGVINDGSELFGTKSGDGFKDLAAYDSDNNGWIDENDKIYNELKAWLRGEDGVDTLLSLKDADVGAIYLGSAQTEYTHMNSSFMMSAMMRSSGIFLRESGGVGTVHQIDLAAMEEA